MGFERKKGLAKERNKERKRKEYWEPFFKQESGVGFGMCFLSLKDMSDHMYEHTHSLPPSLPLPLPLSLSIYSIAHIYLYVFPHAYMMGVLAKLVGLICQRNGFCGGILFLSSNGLSCDCGGGVSHFCSCF